MWTCFGTAFSPPNGRLTYSRTNWRPPSSPGSWTMRVFCPAHVFSNQISSLFVAILVSCPCLRKSGRLGLHWPFLSQQRRFDPVCVEKIVQRQMAKHDEHRVVTVLAVLGRATPILGRQATDSLDDARSIGRILSQRSIEIHL